MANQLSADQLAALYQQFLQGNYSLNSNGFGPMAVVHSGEDAQQPSQLLGYGGNYSGLNPGSTYDLYGTDGSYAGQRQVENGGSVGDLLKGTVKDLGPAAALFASMYLGGQGLGALAGGGGAGLAGDATAIGYDPGAIAAAGGANTAAMGAGAGGYFTLPDIADVPALSSSVAGLSPLEVGGAAAGGAAGAAAGGAGASSVPGWMQSLGISPSMLGVGASLLGAVAGSKPVKTTTDQTRQPWAPLQPYLTNPGGLLDSTNKLMQQQMGYVPQQAQQISNIGMGLLSNPVAGNGFNQFMQRPRFGGF